MNRAFEITTECGEKKKISDLHEKKKTHRKINNLRIIFKAVLQINLVPQYGKCRTR